MKGKPVIAIDLDGVLMKNTSGANYQDPMPNASVVVKELHKNFEIVIFTARMNGKDARNVKDIRKNIADWCAKNDIPFDDITAVKPKALMYIDDRCLRFTNWMDIKNYFLI